MKGFHTIYLREKTVERRSQTLGPLMACYSERAEISEALRGLYFQGYGVKFIISMIFPMSGSQIVVNFKTNGLP
jgi:hypothetical protein